MTKNFFTGMLAGVVIGAVGALMLAPMEGTKARSVIKEAAHSTGTKVRSAATRVGQKTHKKMGAIKQAM
ncbi:MAG: YtxH domain-containing protein [Armatimonadota bacterium]